MRKIYLIIFCFLSASLHAQIFPIDTDRPDQTESAFLVPENWLQFEMGFNYQKNDKAEKEFLTPTLLSKYGVSKRIELRLITTIKTNSFSNTTNGKITETGLDVTEVGAKIAFFEEKKFLPKTSLIFHFGIPDFSSPKLRPDKIAPNFRFTMQHTLSPKTSLGYNVGCEWDGYTNNPAYIYTFTLGSNFAEKWYGYIESFGAVKKQLSPEHSMDGGIAYFISNNFKVDLSSGFGLTTAAPKWYLSIGASVRLNTSTK